MEKGGEEFTLLVWGLFLRAYGLVGFIATIQLFPRTQILLWGGQHGVSPAHLKLARIAQDFPQWWRRVLYFPTLAWINSSDSFLRALVLVGAAAALGLVLGVASPIAAVVFWMVYLSLAFVIDAEFPWDGKLSLFASFVDNHTEYACMHLLLFFFFFF